MATLSRTPSPAAGSGSDSDFAVATPLTPRTKLRELFATIDGGDGGGSSGSEREREGNEENTTPSRKAKKPASRRSGTKSPGLAGSASPLRTASSNRSRMASPLVGALNASSDEDSDVGVRPRGRFAARMQAASSNQPTATAAADTTETAEPQAGNARQRVKRMLQLAAQAEKQQLEGTASSKSHEDTNHDAEDDDDDEDDAPVAAAARPRKRLVNHRTSRCSASASPRQASTPSRSSTAREASPTMFMTPTKQLEREDSPDMFMTPAKGGDNNDGDNNSNEAAGAEKPGQKARFQAMVARKREELRAREEAEERKRAARLAAMAERNDSNGDDDDDDDEAMGDLDDDDDLLMRDADDINGNVSDITDDEGGRRLTQDVAGARPARKASKKALEEMHRETQRMSRNLQLAHEAKTRKKITKASLFERFNFKPQGVAVAVAAAASASASAAPAAQEPTSSSRPTSPASPQNHTDTEARGGADTPPSSPPVPAAHTVPLDKGKGKAIEIVEEQQQQPQPQPTRQVRVRLPISAQANLVMIDSDDDELEIVQTTKNKLDILFDSVPLKRNQEPRSMMALRRLAGIGSPGKKPRSRPAANGGSTSADLTLGELQQSLQDRARRQAKVEREQRLEALRAKGIRIQTEEEREQEMEEVDDIVARARQEAEELMQRERDEAKKEKKGDDDAAGAADPLDWDDSDDEEGGGGEYQPDEEEGEEEAREIELSGSEDEENEEEEDDGDEETMEGALIDDEAESAEESEDGKDEDEEADGTESNNASPADVLPTPTRARPAKRRLAVVLSDDEEEEGDAAAPAAAAATPLPSKVEAKTPGPKTAFAKSPAGLSANNSDSPQVPTSVLRSATKPFIPGLPVAVGGPAGLGLTQIFAGTLADNSQLGGSAASGGFGSPSQFMPTIGNFVDVDFSQAAGAGTAGDAPSAAAAVLDSQPTQEWIQRMQGGGSNSNGNSTNGNNDSGSGGDGDNHPAAPSQMVQFSFSQSQEVHGLDSLLREPDVSQMTELLGPSQDTGPQAYTPLKVRFIEHQPLTMDTVILDEQTQLVPQQQQQQQTQLQLPSQTQSQTQAAQTQMASPSPSQPAPPRRPKGRLFRKTDVVKIDEEEDEEDVNEAEEQAVDATATAFSRMQQAAAQKKLFDRKKSKAKEMIEEQAEESEDEYAGLGGADGEDSDNESLASVQDMIDDDQKVSSTDNAKLAAFYADREREHDEKQVEKLFRDVTTGMLRRKRGAGGGGDYDLSDSDDGGEARRRMKRRQFARMQKALFADERISKVAENPRNQAFLRTIEDRGSDDEMDFIFDGAAAAPAGTTASEDTTAAATTAPAEVGGAQVAIPDSQPTATVPTPTTAPLSAALADQQPPNRRRRVSAASGKKPSNLGEIRESLSSLLEDYRNGSGSHLSVVADSEFGSDGEEEDDSPAHDKENHQPRTQQTQPRHQRSRRPGRSHNVQVVDRITLKRNGSSSSSASAATGADSGSGSGAGAAAGDLSSMGPTGFRVPALLRRATTNSLVSNSSSSSISSGSGSSGSGSGRGATTMSANASGGGGGDGSKADHQGKIKKNASKMSGIHYFARENERRAALAESEKRRQAKRVRSAEGRSRAVGGLFGAGKFE